MGVNEALSLAQEKTRVYCEESELWKSDHELAMAFYNFQDFLEFGVGLFDSITKIDEDWRLRVLKRECDYEAGFAEALLRVYRQWLQACPRLKRSCNTSNAASVGSTMPRNSVLGAERPKAS